MGRPSEKYPLIHRSLETFWKMYMRLRTLENLTVKITFFCKEIPMLIPDKFAQLFSRWSGLMFDILNTPET